MYQSYTAETIDSDNLTSVSYQFWLNDRLELELDSYMVCKRPSTRHKFKPVSWWNRLNQRDSTIKVKPIAPDWAHQMALKMARDSITIKVDNETKI